MTQYIFQMPYPIPNALSKLNKKILQTNLQELCAVKLHRVFCYYYQESDG